MKPSERIRKSLARHGRDVTVKIMNDSFDCRAMILPLRYKNKQYLEADVTEFGIKDNSRSVYIGPVTPDFSGQNIWAETRVRTADRVYTVARADRIYFGNEPAYIWAILVNTTEE